MSITISLSEVIPTLAGIVVITGCGGIAGIWRFLKRRWHEPLE